MKALPTENNFAASGFFVLRTPLLPFDELLAWGDGLEASASLGDPARLAEALGNDRARLRSRLAAIVARPEVREGLFVASPSLDESLEVWLHEPESDRGRRIERALVKYVARMAGRATPFGLFAGCSVGSLGDATHLALDSRDSSRRHTRLDTDYLFALVESLARDSELRRAFSYRPNSTLYEMTGHFHYVEARVDATRRSYHLVSAEGTKALKRTVGCARDGATIEMLSEALVSEDVSREEAQAYVTELIDSQLLVPDLAVPVTVAAAGTEPLDVLIADLEADAATALAAEVLAEARRSLAEIDTAGFGVASERYRATARALEVLPPKVDMSRLFQVDLVKSSSRATLGPEIVGEIVKGVEILCRLARRQPPSNLQRFREAFASRYEQREVPLVEALDEEHGIGFGSGSDTAPLLQGLAFEPPPNDTLPWGPRELILFRTLGETIAAGRQEIALTMSDLDRLADKAPLPLPGSFAVIANVAASSAAAMATGNFRIRLHSAHGPSGARLLGRFCHADAVLQRHVEEHLRAEESLAAGAVFAEIVHLPEGRLGNILFRPVLRSYEIPYLGKSGAVAERQIPVTDLMVSVVGGEIVLRSATLDRRIFPRLSAAHNFTWQSLPVYRFLCALQSHGVTAALGWDWGPLSAAPFLPRVVHGRLVLAPARWRIEKEEVKRLGAGADAASFAAVQSWRAERRFPRWMVLADGDNTLPVDLDNALSVEAFVQAVKDRDEAALEELFPAPDQLCAAGPEGRFVHELVIPFVQTGDPLRNAAEPTSDRSRPSPPSVRRIRRTLPPGSEWLFVKLYTGSATADQVLREVIGPVVRQSIAVGTADRWFFIRYRDPEPHLRVRVHGIPEVLQAVVCPALLAAGARPFDDGRVWRVVVDTYEREVERYGGPDGILLAERLFHADSEAVLEIMELLDSGDAGLDERWRLALYGMDRLLADLEFATETRIAMVTDVRNSLAQELRCNREVDHQLGRRFRKERPSLVDILAADVSGSNPLEPGLEVLRQRSLHLQPIVAELKAYEAAGRLTMSRRQIAMSYLHMHVNRLLRSVQREQEFVLYDFLLRCYESQAARNRSVAIA